MPRRSSRRFWAVRSPRGCGRKCARSAGWLIPWTPSTGHSAIPAFFGIGAGVAGSDIPEFLDVTIDTLREATLALDDSELKRAKAQMKVGLQAAMETPGGRIERMARQILAWGRVVPVHDLVAKVEALDVDEVRSAGAHLLESWPTLAAIGPIETLLTLEAIADRLAHGEG